MKLLNHKVVHFSRNARVFRYNYSLLRLLLASALFSGVVFYCWQTRIFPFGVLLFSGGGILLFICLLWMAYFKSLSDKTNWLIGFDSGRVYISFRSFLNSHFKDNIRDARVLELEFVEIRAVRKRTEKVVYKTSRGNHQHVKYVYLDILLKNECPPEVKAAIAGERQLNPEGHAKVHHYPVTLHSDRSLQLAWSSPSASIRPGIGKCLGIFSFQVSRTADIFEKLDFRKNVKAAETDQMLKKLLARGYTLAAESIVRHKYGKTLAEAISYLEDLSDGQAI